jgi:hypothetical protein
MKRYFRVEYESVLGPSVVYHEFDGDEPVRQAERVGERWISSREAHHPELGPGLVDLPLTELEFEPGQEIDAAEFERAWRELRNRRGCRSSIMRSDDIHKFPSADAPALLPRLRQIQWFAVTTSQTWRFEGDDAVVVLNTRAQVVTTWAKSRTAWRNPRFRDPSHQITRRLREP